MSNILSFPPAQPFLLVYKVILYLAYNSAFYVLSTIFVSFCQHYIFQLLTESRLIWLRSSFLSIVFTMRYYSLLTRSFIIECLIPSHSNVLRWFKSLYDIQLNNVKPDVSVIFPLIMVTFCTVIVSKLQFDVITDYL